jgi:long-chain acyl-CoA synthetase
MMIQDLLAASTERDPGATLLVDGDHRTTYGEIDQSSNRIARLLVESGVHRGDRIGLLIANSARYVASYYGVLKTGAIVVPLHAASDVRTLRRLLGDCGARGLIAGPGFAPLVAQAAEELPDFGLAILPSDGDRTPLTGGFPAHVRFVPESALSEMRRDAPPPNRRGIDIDLAAIIYTSGSTGRPRGATLSHLNVVANTRSIIAYLGLTSLDRVLCVLPFSYVYGKSLLNTHVAVGGSVVLHENMTFPDTALDAMESAGVTGFSGVPSTFAILLNRSSIARRRIPSLRYVTQAGGGMPIPHIRAVMEALPGVRIFIMYGATEASARLSWLDPSELPKRIGSIGKAIPNVELTIRREDGSEADPGEIGEIVARGSNIMEGYWGDPAATAEVLDANGFHTGDLGLKDADGFIWHQGRKREMIKSGAHRISPREIEEVLLEHPDIEEAAVVGKKDEYLGETIVAHVTVRPGSAPTAPSVRSFCQQRLPAHKAPHEVVIHEAMPRSPAGKIDKKVLRGDST